MGARGVYLAAPLVSLLGACTRSGEAPPADAAAVEGAPTGALGVAGVFAPPRRAVALPGLRVTHGEVASAGTWLHVEHPAVRAVLRDRTAQDLEVRFRYLGPTSKQVALASGETRVQIGVKLRAQDGCNVVYAMLRIARARAGEKPVDEKPSVVVQVKRNPDARTHDECGARGYRTVTPAELAPAPEIAMGSTHRLRAAMRGRTVDVWLDGDAVWTGDVGPEALELDGPAGVRTDNGRFELEIAAPVVAAPPAAPSP